VCVTPRPCEFKGAPPLLSFEEAEAEEQHVLAR